MSAKLKQSVISGGKVYHAGTEATAALRKAIPAKFWDDIDPAPTGDDGGDLAEVRQMAAAQFAAYEETIEGLNAQIDALKADNDDLRSQVAALSSNGADESDERSATVDYDALDVDALKAEIDRRNEGRDDEAKVSKRGGKDTLVAALRSDDEAAES
ncbi:hypothetical protein ACFVJS_03825 [Nocardioides sp. NPDC057772]|uniref:hypothetical protein n=1 Tax=Nocardioides sp. NPDC057772 TaxID=3346245 RepID=UPI003671E35D